MQVSAQWVAERRQTDMKMTDVLPTFQLLSVIHFEFKSDQASVFCSCGLLCLSPSPQIILQMQGSNNEQLPPPMSAACRPSIVVKLLQFYQVRAGLVLYAHWPHFPTREHTVIENLQMLVDKLTPNNTVIRNLLSSCVLQTMLQVKYFQH